MSMSGSHATPGDFRVGDRVRIHPNWQDPGDDSFERVVIEAPPDSPRVLVRTLIPGFEHPPCEWIETAQLIRLPPGGT